MSSEAPRLRSVALLLAAAAYAIFLSRHASFSVGGSDSSGYAMDLCYARWDAMTPDSSQAFRESAEGKGYRIFALLFPEEEKQIEAHMPGR
jgi:hypothetical protein